MTSRSAAIQGGLALAGLVAAYSTWQREPGLVAGEVFVLDITRTDLERVRYQDEEQKAWAEIVKSKDQNGTFVSVRLSGSDASGVALPSGHPSVVLKVPEREIRGNESAQRLFERFAPLRGSRALGTLDAQKLKDLGLDSSKKRIEVVARGATRQFAIVPAPPGGSDPYLRDVQDGRVYIVPRQILSDFQSANVNLVERRLHSFRLEEIDQMMLAAGPKTRELRASRVDPNLPGLRVAPASTPDKPDETAKNWHDRVWNLFPSEVLGKGELPGGRAPKVVVRMDYQSRGRSLGWIELGRTGSDGAVESSLDQPPAEVAYARSEFTLGWVKLPAEALSLLSEGEGLAAK